MEPWTDTELDALGTARELEISSRRGDGTLSPPVTIWAVRHGDDVYVRSVNGPSATWYSSAQRRGAGSISSGGVERQVQFLGPEGDVVDANRQRVPRQVRSVIQRHPTHHRPAGARHHDPASPRRPQLTPFHLFPKEITMSSNQHSGRVGGHHRRVIGHRRGDRSRPGR